MRCACGTGTPYPSQPLHLARRCYYPVASSAAMRRGGCGKVVPHQPTPDKGCHATERAHRASSWFDRVFLSSVEQQARANTEERRWGCAPFLQLHNLAEVTQRSFRSSVIGSSTNMHITTKLVSGGCADLRGPCSISHWQTRLMAPIGGECRLYG